MTMENEYEKVEAELTRTRENIARLEKEMEDKPDYGLGEGDPAIVRWELNQALLQQSRERVASLEQALSRLEQGIYGVCERCSSPIHPDRLAVLPDVRLCIRCARTAGSSYLSSVPGRQQNT
ncbi:MAG: TraR/DksA C4-type zinc finger protein [Anaerolineae bacterium]|nr:TraR/DksA C4-type zinc finger protein [Anaerolineae bacterium]